MGRWRLPPPLVLILLYCALIVIGTLAFKLPIATTAPITWSDAAFTATSAITVTGLGVVDTGSTFTLFGQAVLLVLIQCGGLGIMTFAILILSMLGLHIGISHRHFLREDLNQTSIHGLLDLVRIIFRFVLICQAVGALLLCLVFVPEFGLGRGLWMSLFHAVSAFNNAGFALFPDSLSAWVGHPVINIVIPALFIVGGIGATVVMDLRAKRRWHQLSLHTKLMLIGTAILLTVPTFAIAAMEWTNPATLGALESPWTRFVASWFQAATARTAGFNTIDIGGFTNGSSLMYMVLMVVGAGSTSTGGGIKVTTFIVLLLATKAFFQRRTAVDIFGRRLGSAEIMKVLALSMVSVLTLFTALFILILFHEGEFLDLMFETASAFGTVGVSRGTTGDLDTAGRVVIMCVMFVGRVGPLTLGFILAMGPKRRIAYPAGTVHLG
ncbi:TrkH family potassium uptake protein [Amaricoccus macauensis]|uniref:TrkH family potassium uptake protein n=1 Tax=Amaricoccus macauensis TaxID=57001 RepID=UPI003C7C10F5